MTTHDHATLKDLIRDLKDLARKQIEQVTSHEIDKTVMLASIIDDIASLMFLECTLDARVKQCIERKPFDDEQDSYVPA